MDDAGMTLPNARYTGGKAKSRGAKSAVQVLAGHGSVSPLYAAQSDSGNVPKPGAIGCSFV